MPPKYNTSEKKSDNLASDTQSAENTGPTPVFSTSSKELECPIYCAPIRVPVITNRGNTYDFIPLAEWLIKSPTHTDPQTKTPVTALTLNRAVWDEEVILLADEKNTIADMYLKLTPFIPENNLSTILTIHGIQELINQKRPEGKPIQESLGMQDRINSQKLTIKRLEREKGSGQDRLNNG